MTEAEVRTLLARMVPTIEWAGVAADASLDGAGLDSLDKASLIMELETELSIKIDDERYEELDTINDLVKLGQ